MILFSKNLMIFQISAKIDDFFQILANIDDFYKHENLCNAESASIYFQVNVWEFGLSVQSDLTNGG